MQTFKLFRVLNTEKNCLWYKDLVGRLINEAQFNSVLFNSFLDVRAEVVMVRDVTEPNN
jgi:hypothetical protein